MSILKKKPKKERKLNPREAKFFDLLAKDPTMTITEAGRQAGYSENTVQGPDLYRKVHDNPRNPLQKALVKAGLTEDAIAKKMTEGINAFSTKIISRKIRETRTANGKEIEYETLKENQVDFNAREKYLKLWGMFTGNINPSDEAPNKTSISINNVVINNDIDINQAVQIYQDTLNNLEDE